MAIEDQVGGIFGDLFGGAFAIVIWIIIGFTVLSVIGILVYFFVYQRRKYDIEVKVISKRSGKDKIFFDRGAILRDRKNNTDYIRLKNSKAQLELPKFDIMHQTNKGDYLEILRESERGYRFLTPAKIDKKYLLRYDGKKYPIAQLKQYQIENDLAWILERLKTNKRIINPESILMKLLEYTPQILSMVFSFIIIWIVFRYAPELLNSMRELINDANRAEAVQVIGQNFIPILLGLTWKKKTS